MCLHTEEGMMIPKSERKAMHTAYKPGACPSLQSVATATGWLQELVPDHALDQH